MHGKKGIYYSRIGLLILDFIVIACLFFYFLFYRYDYLYKEKTFETLTRMFEDQYKAFFLLLISWYLISHYSRFYNDYRFNRFLNILRRCISQIFIFALILYTISGVKVENLFTNKQSFIFLSILSLFVLFTRAIIFFTLKSYRKKGYNLRKVILLGYNDNSGGLEDLLAKKTEFGLHIKDIFVVKNPKDNQTLLDLNNLNHYLVQNKIDFAYISLGNGMDDEMVTAVTNILEDKYIPIGFIPSSSLEIRQSLEINYLDSFPILTYKKYPLDHAFNQFTKRAFDLVFTMVVFAFLLWWLLPLISIMVYFSQGRPILFKQKRNGLNGKEFDCLKFRTMRPHKFNDIKPTERDDPRVTKLGKILRKTSLDELPQFINVLKGEMSIVGPRPHMVSENESYSEIIKRYSLRHYVKPGITGLAQVKGYRGAIDSDKDMEMRIRTDIYYVRNWSFLLDLFIIYKTAKLMIFGDENAI